MSNDPSIDESNRDSLSRRKLLRTTAAASGAGGFSIFTSRSVRGAESSDKPFTVTDVRVKSASAAVADRTALEKTTKTKQLASVMNRDTDRKTENSTISFQLDTKEQEVQKLAPAVTVVPMKPSDKDWNNLSISDVSLQFSMTIEEKGKRSPVAAMGMSFQNNQTKHNNLTTMDSSLSVNVYGEDDTNNIGVVDTKQVSAPKSNKMRALGIKCDGCKVVVGALCVGVNTTLGRAGCVSRCVPILVANPWIGSGCGALCFALTSTIGKIACGSGGLSEAACRVAKIC